MTRPQRWNRLSQQLLRWVDPVRGEELRTHIDDATSQGEPLRAADTASVLGMVARTQARRAMGQLPMVLAGLPVALLCIVAYGMIYETHFVPWDVMEEVPSTDPTAAALRRATYLAWIVLVPLALLSGWRVAGAISRGNYVLPAAYLVGLFVLISQADIFIERTAWFADGRLRARHVDDVSPYSIGLLAMAFALPLVYLTLDAIARRTRSKPPTVARPAQAVRVSDRSWDSVGLAALAAPVVWWLWSLPALLLYLLLTWLAPSFGLKHKIAATLSVVVPVATAAAAALLAGPDGIDDPNVVVVMVFLGIFVIVWVWLATVVFRRTKVAASPGMASLVR